MKRWVATNTSPSRGIASFASCHAWFARLIAWLSLSFQNVYGTVTSARAAHSTTVSVVPRFAHTRRITVPMSTHAGTYAGMK